MNQVEIEAKFPHGCKVRHRSFGRYGHVKGWAEQRGRWLLIVEVVQVEQWDAGMATDAEWTANSCQFIENNIGMSLKFRVAAANDRNKVRALPDFAFIIPKLNPPLAQVNHAAKKAKPDMDMLMQFPNALSYAAEVLKWAESAKGYGFQEFMKLDAKELRAAMMRHTFKTGRDGRDLDDESKKLHAAHALINALMLVEKLLG